jgi:hypothetical protein
MDNKQNSLFTKPLPLFIAAALLIVFLIMALLPHDFWTEISMKYFQ